MEDKKADEGKHFFRLGVVKYKGKASIPTLAFAYDVAGNDGLTEVHMAVNAGKYKINGKNQFLNDDAAVNHVAETLKSATRIRNYDFDVNIKDDQSFPVVVTGKNLDIKEIAGILRKEKIINYAHLTDAMKQVNDRLGQVREGRG